MTEHIKSPCIGVCKLDAQDICTGCHRTAEEIASWLIYSDEQKRAVLFRLDARQNIAPKGAN